MICNHCISSAWHISQFSSVAQLCPTLCGPMNRTTPSLPVHHQLPESTQTHVHWVSDAIQPSHPLSSPSPPAFNLSHHRSFSNESALSIRWPNYWSFSFNISPSNEHPGLISFSLLTLHQKMLNTLHPYSIQFSCSVVSDSLWPHGL